MDTSRPDASSHPSRAPVPEDETSVRREARYRALFEQSGEVMLITDVRGVIEWVNPTFERVTGYSQEEVLGRTPGLLKSGLQDDMVYQHLWRTIASGRTWQGSLVNRRRDGSLYTSTMTIAPVRDGRGEISGYIGVGRDVTGELGLAQQLYQSQKTESIGRLAGGIAHDFNNLLTVINGNTDLLLETCDARSPHRPALVEIKEAGERAAALTRQLLAFSRKQVLQPAVVDLNDVVGAIHPMINRLIGEDIELQLGLAAVPVIVRADRHQLEQVLVNLAVNARDAMPNGGRLLIETAAVDFDDDYARAHPGARPGPHALLAVSDTGFGMDEPTRRTIFEPFFTTKAPGRGTGLGLSVVQGVVVQSGGQIEVYSEPERGTTFKIYLPRRDGVPAEHEAPGPVAGRGAGETILVVEDQDNVRAFVARSLQDYGYRVVEAKSAAEAVGICIMPPHAIDLVLTDVVMPEIGGRQLADRLRDLQPSVKLLFMSGYTDKVAQLSGLIHMGAGFIQKPFSPGQLAAKVRTALGSPGTPSNGASGG